MTASITICKHCGRDKPADRHYLCKHCETTLQTDLEWMERNLDLLEDYRLNRAYGTHEGGGGGYTASAPVREQVSALLYDTDSQGRPSINETLNGFADCLAIHRTAGMRLSRTAHAIRSSIRLTASSATPVYMRDIHALKIRARQLLEEPSDDMICYGACPDPECGRPVSAPRDAPITRCRWCGNTWLTAQLRETQRERLRNCNLTGTQSELIRLLAAGGILVKPSTVRSWVHRRKLPQAGENAEAQPVYRVMDLFALIAVKEGWTDCAEDRGDTRVYEHRN